MKDVSATAIYGSRGSNGVIIVTTKSGQSGKTVVTYDGMVGFTTPTNLPEMFNGPEYVAYAKEAINGGSNHNPFVGREKENADNGNFTDWLDYTLQNGFQTSHSVSLTGGSEKEKHIMSVGYVNQTGSIEGEQMERFTSNWVLKARLVISLWDCRSMRVMGILTMVHVKLFAQLSFTSYCITE